MNFRIALDKHGLPWSEYGVYKGMGIGRQNSVLYVSEWGLLLWRKWISKSDDILLSSRWWKKLDDQGFKPTSRQTAIDQIMYCAEWLHQRVENRQDFSVWTHPYPMSFGMQPGWASAHSQAVALQLLSRANEFAQGRYSSSFDALLRAFEVDVEQGGLRDCGESGNDWWYTKFAQAGVNAPRVLNGMLFSLIGLHDIWYREKLEYAKNLFQRGAEEALAKRDVFDTGTWSLYDDAGKVASRHYHNVVVKQLKFLRDTTGLDGFSDWFDS